MANNSGNRQNWAMDVLTRSGMMSVFRNDIGAATQSLVKYGEWAWNEISFMLQFVRPDSTVIDVGAYVGTHTLAFAKFVGANGHVYSLEAQGSTYKLLLENIARNNLTQVSAINAAASSTSGYIELDLIDVEAKDSFGSAAIKEQDASGERAKSSHMARVKAIKLDDLAIVGRPSLIKVDVEGMESLVLEGAGEVLQASGAIVYLECNSIEAGSKTLDVLHKYGYATFVHVVDAYNSNNWRGDKVNIFGYAREVAIVGLPISRVDELRNIKQRDFEDLFEAKTLDDLCAAMLLKPQYPYEVLQYTEGRSSPRFCRLLEQISTSDFLERTVDKRGEPGEGHAGKVVKPVTEQYQPQLIDPPSVIDRVTHEWALSDIERWGNESQLTVVIVGDPGSQELKVTERSIASQWHSIKTKFVAKSEDTISAINRAIMASDTEWVTVLDAGCELFDYSAFRVMVAIRNHPEWQVVYTDEDSISGNDANHNPHFKPDFNLDYLRSMPYVGGLLLIRRKLFVAIGGLDCNCDGVEDYDFILRAWEHLNGKGEANAIGHVAAVMFRRLQGTTHAQGLLSSSVENAANALRRHLERLDIRASVEPGPFAATFRVIYKHNTQPLVSIIIPSRNQRSMLQRCLESIFSHTTWQNFEIIVVDNGSDESDAVQYLEGLRVLGGDLDGRIRIIDYPEPFNYSAMNNLAARHAQGDYLLLLNNDTAALHDDWLDAMMAHAQRHDVGVVGAKLLYPDGKVQHAGVILGMKGPAEHPFIGRDAKDFGYFGRLQLEQNYSAVTGACLLVRRSLFEAVGGLDETELAVSYSDIDLCLKVREQGYLVVWTPNAVLLHEGSKSQKSDVENAAEAAKAERFNREQAVMYRRWLPIMASDPAYNRYLSLGSTEFLPETDAALQWDPEWRPAPRIIAQPADRMGCGEYRIIAPTRALIKSGRIQGLESQRIYAPAELARIRPDSLVLQRQVEIHQIDAIERHKRFNDVFCVFEIDDLVNNVPVKSVHKKLLPKDLFKRLRRAVAACDRLVVSTEPLAEAYHDLCPDIRVVPNYIEDARWGGLTPRRRVGRKPRVGWAGGISHTGDLDLIEGVVEALKDEVEWVFFGMCPEKIRPYVHEFVGPVPLEQYAQCLAGLNLDLAIAPLEDVPFNHSKSALRLLEYGVLGYPVVCSDLTPYRGDFPVTRVRNRFRDWVEAIREHLADLDAAAAQGDLLRDHVRQHWLLENNLDAWLEGWLPDGKN